MLLRLGSRVSRGLALVLLATMAIVPPAMAWADASPAAAAHTADHHRAPGSHDQFRDDCCDLCLASCIACVGLIGAATTLHSRTAPWVVPVILGPAVQASAASGQIRLPFPLGPPLLHA